jgi:hypothetical protein
LKESLDGARTRLIKIAGRSEGDELVSAIESYLEVILKEVETCVAMIPLYNDGIQLKSKSPKKARETLGKKREALVDAGQQADELEPRIPAFDP